MLMLMSSIPSMLIPFIKHPLSMGMILLSQTIIFVLIASWTTLTSWYSYIAFIIMVGGMLVLFLYMTSVASNEKFSFSWIMFFLLSVISILSISSLCTDIWLQLKNISNQEIIFKNSEFFFSLNKFFNFPSIFMAILLIIYLLITLIAVIKITNIKHGAMRNSN